MRPTCRVSPKTLATWSYSWIHWRAAATADVWTVTTPVMSCLEPELSLARIRRPVLNCISEPSWTLCGLHSSTLFSSQSRATLATLRRQHTPRLPLPFFIFISFFLSAVSLKRRDQDWPPDLLRRGSQQTDVCIRGASRRTRTAARLSSCSGPQDCFPQTNCPLSDVASQVHLIFWSLNWKYRRGLVFVFFCFWTPQRRWTRHFGGHSVFIEVSWITIVEQHFFSF